MVLQGRTDAEFLMHIENAPVTIDQWQLEKLAMVTMRQHVLWYVPGAPAEYRDKLWGRCYPSVQSAIADMAASLAPGARVAVIPDGPYVLGRARTHDMAPA